MKHNVLLIVASLLTLLFTIIHLTQDVILQAEGHVKWPIPVVLFAVWLYATLMGSDRIWGYIVMFLMGVIGAGMIIVHSKAFVVGKSGGFFFVFTMFTLSATGLFTAILAGRAIWTTVRSRRATGKVIPAA
jgi:hypothetical protein